MRKPAIRKKSAWCVGPGWPNGDVVGLVMRKNGLVRDDSQPGFVSYLDEVKPAEITPTRFEEPTTDETSPS